MDHGDVINHRYNVRRKLGQGGMGMVYLVEDTHRDDLSMALKTMISNDIDQEFLNSFRQEFSELAKLRHPNVASAYDFGRISGTHEHFFTTEFVDGTDLYKGTGRASFDQILDITTQLLRGLDFIHKHGLLHNDLKPANILVADVSRDSESSGRGDMSRLESAVFGLAGQVKLIDFGLLSGLGVAWKRIRGTSRYLSPERIRCAPADARADLYSLGCVLYLLAARRYAFNEVDTKKILKLHLESAPVRLDSICSAPPAYADFVHRLLEKNPDDRFASAEAALQFLGEALQLGRQAAGKTKKTPRLEAGSLQNRESELALLHDYFEDAVTGAMSAPCVAVEGKSGVGKTRLVEELKSTVQVKDGAFISYEDTAVQGHLQPILDGFLGGLRTSGASILKDIEAFLAVQKKSDGFTNDLAAILEKIILWCAEEMPLLIHFDDFHSASETVRLFAVGLVQAAFEKLRDAAHDTGVKRPRVLFVLSRRPISDKGTLGLSGIHTLKLEPFSQEGCHTFLRRVFGQEEIPPDVLTGLATAARGNPRFLIELARNLVDHGHVAYNGARWEFPESLERIPLPESIRGAMDERVAALGQDATTILQWIALAHVPIGLETLVHCTLLERERIKLVTQNLLESGFLQKDEIGHQRRHYLAYPDLKESMIGKISGEQLRFMHQRLAQGIEKEYRGTTSSEGELAELLAAHWLAAGNMPAFLRFAPSAAAHLQECGNLELAVDYHRRIAESLPDEAAAKKVKSLVKLSEMHEFLWDLKSSERDIKSVLNLGEHILKPHDRVSLLRRLASLAISQNDIPGAVHTIHKALRIAGKSIDPLVKMSLAAPEAWARWFSKDRERARELIDYLKTDLPSHGSAGPREKAILVGTQNYLANLYHQLGKLDRCIWLHRANLAMLEDLDSEQALASCLCSLGSALLDVGSHEEAHDLLQRALDKGKSIGDRRTLCRAREKLGEYHFLYGDLKTALQMTQVGLQDARNIHHLSATANSLRMLGRIYQRAGQPEDAQEVLNRAVSLHRDTGDVMGAPLSRICLARLHLAQSRPDLAEKELKEAQSVIEEYDLAFARGHYQLHLLEARLADTGELDITLVDRARSALEEGGFRRDLCDLELIACRGALESGDIARAKMTLNDLREPLAEFGSVEQKTEAAYVEALVEIAAGNHGAGALKLSEVRRMAKNSVFPEIAARCRERLDALKAANVG